MTLYAHVNGSTVDTVSARPRTDRRHQGDTMKTAAATLAALIAFTLGLLYEPTPMTPAPSGTILDGGTL